MFLPRIIAIEDRENLASINVIEDRENLAALINALEGRDQNFDWEQARYKVFGTVLFACSSNGEEVARCSHILVECEPDGGFHETGFSSI